jgi:hypothetical protein
MKKYYQEDVDKWVEENDCYDANALLDEKLPNMKAKLNRLDKKIRDVLSEVRKVFPDAQYYTASGGFNLVLGATHSDEMYCPPQQQRIAWGGHARISDGDW